ATSGFGPYAAQTYSLPPPTANHVIVATFVRYFWVRTTVTGPVGAAAPGDFTPDSIRVDSAGSTTLAIQPIANFRLVSLLDNQVQSIQNVVGPHDGAMTY